MPIILIPPGRANDLKRPPRFTMHTFWGLLWRTATIVLAVITVTLASKGFFEPPDFSTLKDPKQTSIIFDLDGNPLHIYCQAPYCREIIPLDKMGEFPELTIAVEDKSFYWRPFFFDPRGVIRAALLNVRMGQSRFGGSTITQQTVKNLFLQKEVEAEMLAKNPREKSRASWWRKGREAYVSLFLEARMSRRQILELYLNNVWCGARYGVQLCSRFLFGKEAKDVSMAEAAFIVGTFRMPSMVSDHRVAHKVRSRVIQQFINRKKIKEDEIERLNKQPLPLIVKGACESSHFDEYIRQQLTKNGKLVNRGLKVTTTLDCPMQTTAKKALRFSMDAMIERNPVLAEDLRGIALLIDRHGNIKVFAQEPDFTVNQNLLTDMWRQAGSAYKPLAFGTMILKLGLRWTCDDEGSGPCVLHDYQGLSIKMGGGRRKTIRNIDNIRLEDYAGATSPLRVFSESRNSGTMSAVQGVYGGINGPRVSVEEIMEFAARLKLTFPTMPYDTARKRGVRLLGPNKMSIPANAIHPGLTLPIGSVEVNPYEMARAFSAFAFGEMIEPTGIKSIKDSRGRNVQWSVKKDSAKKNIFLELVREKARQKYYEKIPYLEFVMNLSETDEKKIKDIADAETQDLWHKTLRGLRATMELPNGTGHRAFKELGFQLCGKTGTATNAAGESTDNWFIGCTPSYVMVIWIGRDKKLPMPNTYDRNVKVQETGGRNALPVFVETMRLAYTKRRTDYFPSVTDPIKSAVKKNIVPRPKTDEAKIPGQNQPAPDEKTKTEDIPETEN